MLCLDGGGIRGLVQLEILRHIEELTHRKITDLFDWIVGTSTGGIIALGLVYGTCVVWCMLMRLYESGIYCICVELQLTSKVVPVFLLQSYLVLMAQYLTLLS